MTTGPIEKILTGYFDIFTHVLCLKKKKASKIKVSTGFLSILKTIHVYRNRIMSEMSILFLHHVYVIFKNATWYRKSVSGI